MTPGEIALLIGLLANAAALVLGAWINSRKLNLVIADVHKVEVATNSMKDDLVAATKAAALLRGEKTGRADLRAEQAKEH